MDGVFPRMRRAAALLAVCAGCAAAPATASQLIDRNATNVTLEVNAKGEALITYRTGGNLKHVLAWGAVNALPPTADAPQLAFKLDYAGGWGKYHRRYWQTFVNVCRPYEGPVLPWQMAACTAPDGSLWAMQSWQRTLPDYGAQPTAAQSSWELRLSHWTGAPAVLDIHLNWAYRKFDHLFGTLTYRGAGVYGFRSSPAGEPLDSFGRNIYVDTLDSSYGAGWKRENSFLTHAGKGSFCYGFFPHGSHPAGGGKAYRVSVIGPGVTPDVTWQGSAPGPYDAGTQAAADQVLRSIGDPGCKPV
jgi:hypothetical protein